MAALIKTTRIERKITTAKLAERADISRGLLYRIENGDPSCSVDIVFEVASILGIPPVSIGLRSAGAAKQAGS